MISLRLTVPAVLAAAAVAGCITYLLAPVPQQAAEVDQGFAETMPHATVRPDTATSTSTQHLNEEDRIISFQRAADAILKRAENITASAGPDARTIAGPIPLPRRRPIPRP